MIKSASLLGRVFLLFLGLVLNGWAQEGDATRRLVRLESRVYGWYAVADPSFDHTIGRRELFKISGQDKFLEGLAGRLVVIEGIFSEGSLSLPALAPPPVSVGEKSQRWIFVLPAGSTKLTENGYSINDPEGKLNSLRSVRRRSDLVVEPMKDSFRVVRVLSEQELDPRIAETEAITTAELDLTLTQDLLDTIVQFGLTQAPLSVSFQSVTLALRNLRLILPLQVGQNDAPWSMQGSLELALGTSTSLAESSFVVNAQPIIESNVLKIKPDWKNIQVEGQLPFSFVLGTGQLGDYTRYLPSSLPLIDLALITRQLQKRSLVGEEPLSWYLGHPGPGSVRLALASGEQTLGPEPLLSPGRFRLTLGKRLIDRLLAAQVARLLDPHKPYRPTPPIKVGKALFVPIVVDQIFVREMRAGYGEGAFRFDDLTIDVGWKAGPISGQEPLLKASGYLTPTIEQSAQGTYLSWKIKFDEMVVRSSKLPGDKSTIANELIPQMEKALGPDLARKERFSPSIELSKFTPLTGGTLEIMALQPRANHLSLEGRLLNN